MSRDIFYSEILDNDHMNHVCDAMLDAWCSERLDQGLANSLADLVECDLIKPANDWLEREDQGIQERHPGDIQRRRDLAQRKDAAAVLLFLQSAGEVRYRIKYSYYLMPEYVNMLREAWGNMLTAFAGSVQVFVSSALAHEGYRKEQRRKARLNRGRIEADGQRTSITAILQKLAFKKDSVGDYLRSPDLWPELYAELDSLNLGPEETDGEYIFDGGEIKYTSFKVLLSKIRAEKR